MSHGSDLGDTGEGKDMGAPEGTRPVDAWTSAWTSSEDTAPWTLQLWLLDPPGTADLRAVLHSPACSEVAAPTGR